MKYISGVLSIVFLIFIESVSAQEWSVNPADFEFSMNLTGKVILDDGLINDENATIGAFVGDDCVGLTQPTEQTGSFELFLLTVYSNNASGDMIQFKLLKSDSQELSLENEILFQSNAIIGSADMPFVWMETATYSSTDFLSFSHPQQTSDADINPVTHEISLIVDYQIDISDFTPEFELSPGAKAYMNDVLQISGETSLNFSGMITYRVEGVDGSSEDWIVSVELDESAVDLIETIGISVFPNPATEYVKIQIPEHISLAEISVIDMNSKTLMKFESIDSDNLLIPLNQLPTGLYVVQFRLHDKRAYYYRLVKQ
ncbi:MAG: T9SS type A sorting domain-containing protein [Bacteroidales bacterium]|jgi:hypothetical protein|nr:T9SS type A sorting domain-containing protein [Bacteroidales bacterium]